MSTAMSFVLITSNTDAFIKWACIRNRCNLIGKQQKRPLPKE